MISFKLPKLTTGKWVLDVETYGTNPANGKLLGIALAPLNSPENASYTIINFYDFKTSTWKINPDIEEIRKTLKEVLPGLELIGHNYCYDLGWINHFIGAEATTWHADTRLMWHMASNPSGPRGYGLKEAQIEVLGWKEKGNVELNDQIKARGGKPGPDMYLADVEVLGKYACLDATSTALLFSALQPFFDKYDYWWMLEKMMKYSKLLYWNTQVGIKVDSEGLKSTLADLESKKSSSETKLLETLANEIDKLERMWRDDRAAKYTLESAKQRFLCSYDMQKKFKLSSDSNKRELFYDILKLPVVTMTEGKKPSTGVEAVKLSAKKSEDPRMSEIVGAYADYESASTLIDNFCKPWLSSLLSERLHPGFNPCGTVSYRLSGFKPYMLNAPFDEVGLMKNLTCDEGYIGLHSDFVSIEPAVTAHYSQDPSLLKVFRDGLGDVYLDLALTLFPSDEELHKEYNPNVPVTKEIKERFNKQRKVSKIIQLAVQYTGTKYTVHRNLVEAGFKCNLGDAGALVEAYWRHFHRVKVMNEIFFMKYAKQGYLRNAVGRIIRVPDHVKIVCKDGRIWEKPIPRYKDLPNRLIQSSAHDLLSFWVLMIAEEVEKQGLHAKPVIIDCHDSTSWQAPKEEIEALESIFKNSLQRLNESVKLSVELRIDTKRFSTLAGLKGQE